MDQRQVSQMLTWLDEEHRRDKAKVAELEVQNESQAAQIAELSKKVQELEERLTRAQGEHSRFAQIEQALEEAKAELLSMLGQYELGRQREEEEQAKVQQVGWERQERALAELSQRLEEMPKVEERLRSLRLEGERLASAIMDLQGRLPELAQRIDEQTARIPYLEEYRRQDAQRIAGLEQQVEELTKRSEAQLARAVLIEERAARDRQETSQLGKLGEQLRQEQRDFNEKQLLAGRGREQQMADWTLEMENYRKEVREQGLRLEAFREHIAESKQVLAAMSELAERLEREVHQVTELQRLGEERQQKELEERQEENGKRWTKHLMEWQHRWKELETLHERQAERFAQLESWRGEDIQSINELRQLILEERRERQAKLEALWEVQQELANRQIAEMRDWLKALKERADKWAITKERV